MESVLKNCLSKELESLKALALSRSAKQTPELYLYKNGSRNILFRIEGLLRICRKVYDKKTFNTKYKLIKSLEDALGSIDYFDSLDKEFTATRQARSFIAYFNNHTTDKINNFKKVISETNFCTKEFFEDFAKIMSETKWNDAVKEREKIRKFLIRQIEKIEEDFKSGDLNFNDLESGLHEVRRRIRWVSIYASSINGLIQLKKTSAKDESLQKYLTKETVASPFNKFPKPIKGIKSIYITDENFYALSWLINELGILKDEGLKLHEIEIAVKASSLKDKATLKTNLSQNLRPYSALCSHAEQTLREFIFEKKVFEKMKRDLAVSVS